MAGQDEETRVSSVSRIIDKAISGESCLVTIYGRDLGKQYPLSKEEIVIGRGADNDIVLDMDNVSRRHAKVINRKEGFFLEDLGSTNGSYVNDEEVRNRMLKNGDLIKIGGAILKFLQGGNIEALFHEEIYRMTIVDGLTQVHNKRYFLEFMDREMARCARYNRPLSLILFDIDHFKKINDVHGHLAGDFVLKRLAEQVAKHIRKEEAFARYGGEEFAVIMPETTGERARIFAEKIRRMVEVMEYQYEDRNIEVTVSLGISEMGPHRDPHAFIKAADEKLYLAKDNGRNRVEGGGVDGPIPESTSDL
ncbi:MAG: GGDEF domain-containing protein [Myxococcales bacterium]|nr:GGDEF domain-containing protein [Myxococcales bacterium]MCB9646318.1 GGDEF domain-containing protein [Deltaproteobacteria bacterium]